MPGNADATPGLGRPSLVRVLESAARLQSIVPDAVLVGGSAAALWASHRTSFDHDHVLADLNVRFGAVLEAIEATEGWVTNRVTDAEGVATQLARQLAAPRPADQRTIRQLDSYKGLDARWARWETVTSVCRSLAVEMAQ